LAVLNLDSGEEEETIPLTGRGWAPEPKGAHATRKEREEERAMRNAIWT
jgi:hypothetical protein